MNVTTATTTTGKTIAELRAAEAAAHAEYERTTVGAKVTGWNGRADKPEVVTRDVTIAELRAAFDAARLSAGYAADYGCWKMPFMAEVEPRVLMVTVEAIKFFHGVNPHVMPMNPVTGLMSVHTTGYAG